MPRKSTEATLAAAHASAVPTLEAPADLGEAAGAIWYSTIRSKPGAWWSPGRLKLVAYYCQAAAELDRLTAALVGAPDDGKAERRRDIRTITTLLLRVESLSAKLQLARPGAVQVAAPTLHAGGQYEPLKPWEHGAHGQPRGGSARSLDSHHPDGRPREGWKAPPVRMVRRGSTRRSSP